MYNFFYKQPHRKKNKKTAKIIFDSLFYNQFNNPNSFSFS